MLTIRKVSTQHRLAVFFGLSMLAHAVVLTLFLPWNNASSLKFGFISSYSSVSLYPLSSGKRGQKKYGPSVHALVQPEQAVGKVSSDTQEQGSLSQFFQAGGEGFLSTRLRGGNQAPEYPREAREKGLQGVVKLKVQVTREGKARRVEVIQSSGEPILDSAALGAVQQWVFEPLLVAGMPQESVMVIPVRFELKEQ